MISKHKKTLAASRVSASWPDYKGESPAEPAGKGEERHAAFAADAVVAAVAAAAVAVAAAPPTLPRPPSHTSRRSNFISQ